MTSLSQLFGHDVTCFSRRLGSWSRLKSSQPEKCRVLRSTLQVRDRTIRVWNIEFFDPSFFEARVIMEMELHVHASLGIMRSTCM